MKVKRFLSAIIILSVLFSVGSVLAEDNKAQISSGKLGDNIIWTVKDNILTVSGSGATYDFESIRSDSAINPDIARYINTLIIEEGITSIGEKAFSGCYDLTEIIFPKSLQEIGEKAFWGTRVNRISFPEGSSLRTIESEAFKNCSWLEEADLSNCNSLENLGVYSFSDCGNLSSVLFPSDGIFTEISEGAFWGCNGLTSIVLPKGITTIGEKAFYGCWSLHYVYIPETANSIAADAFSGTWPLIFADEGSIAQGFAQANGFPNSTSSYNDAIVIRSGELSNGILWSYTTDGTLTVSGSGEIEDFTTSSHAPWYQYIYIGLKKIIISEGITHIGQESFAHFDNLESVTLPSTLKSIGKNAFYSCDNLKRLVLPDGFAGLGENSLYGCSSLTELVIPSSMYSIGGWALYGLDSAEKYTVAPTNSAFSSDENGVLYNGDKTALIKYPAASKLKSYTVPASVIEIYPYAFDGCSVLEEVKFEENSALASVTHNAFSDSSLKRITLPEGVKFIGEAAFDNCYYLESVVLPDGLTEIKDAAFRWSGIKSVDIPQSVTVIANSAFYGCDNLEEIDLPEGLTAIGWNAFGTCDALKEVSLPASLSWLDPAAFAYSNALEKITVSEQNPYYSTDEYGALYYCKTELMWYPKLSDNKAYTIPAGVTTIQSGVFENANNLEEIIIPSTLSELESSVFQNCKSLKAITIPKEITKIGSSAFSGCTNLSEVIFEENSSLSSIGVYAFYGCDSLKEFNVPDSVTSIYYGAFSGCAYLEKINFSQNSKLSEISGYPFSGTHFVTMNAPYGSFAYEYAEKHRIHLPLTVNINGEQIISEVPPMMVSSRTMIPMRAVFEALKAEVTWNEQTKTAIATKDGITVEIESQRNTMIVNGKEYPLDSPAFIFEERMMIPLRAVSEAFDCDVQWNQDTKTADITAK